VLFRSLKDINKKIKNHSTFTVRNYNPVALAVVPGSRSTTLGKGGLAEKPEDSVKDETRRDDHVLI